MLLSILTFTTQIISTNYLTYQRGNEIKKIEPENINYTLGKDFYKTVNNITRKYKEIENLNGLKKFKSDILKQREYNYKKMNYYLNKYINGEEEGKKLKYYYALDVVLQHYIDKLNYEKSNLSKGKFIIGNNLKKYILNKYGTTAYNKFKRNIIKLYLYILNKLYKHNMLNKHDLCMLKSSSIGPKIEILLRKDKGIVIKEEGLYIGSRPNTSLDINFNIAATNKSIQLYLNDKKIDGIIKLNKDTLKEIILILTHEIGHYKTIGEAYETKAMYNFFNKKKMICQNNTVPDNMLGTYINNCGFPFNSSYKYITKKGTIEKRITGNNIYVTSYYKNKNFIYSSYNVYEFLAELYTNIFEIKLIKEGFIIPSKDFKSKVLKNIKSNGNLEKLMDFMLNLLKK